LGFQNSLNEIPNARLSPNKPFIIGKQIIGNTRVKSKSPLINNGMVEANEHKNKRLVASINKIHAANLKIEDC
jgi:hypothetical protein